MSHAPEFLVTHCSFSLSPEWPVTSCALFVCYLYLVDIRFLSSFDPDCVLIKRSSLSLASFVNCLLPCSSALKITHPKTMMLCTPWATATLVIFVVGRNNYLKNENLNICCMTCTLASPCYPVQCKALCIMHSQHWRGTMILTPRISFSMRWSCFNIHKERALRKMYTMCFLKWTAMNSCLPADAQGSHHADMNSFRAVLQSTSTVLP